MSDISKTKEKTEEKNIEEGMGTIEDDYVEFKISPLIIVSCLLYKLYDGDIKKIKNWILTPNPIFFDSSPFHMVMAGKAEIVINKLNEWLGDAILIKELLKD